MSSRAVRWVRRYFAVVVSLTALTAALAAGLGFFETDLPERRSASQPALAAATPSPATPASAPDPVPRLAVTYFLVATEAEKWALESSEVEMWNREFLGRSAMEVLLAGTPEEEDAAFEAVEAARRRSPTSDHVVHDLR